MLAMNSIIDRYNPKADQFDGWNVYGPHVAGQRERAIETAIAALDPTVAVSVLFLFPTTLSTQGEDLVFEGDFDVVLGKTGKLDHEGIGLVGLADVDGGRPVLAIESRGQGLAEESTDWPMVVDETRSGRCVCRPSKNECSSA